MRERRDIVGGQRVQEGKALRAREFRRVPTPKEAALWERLRGRRLAGHKFRRQQVVDGFIVDFYCAEAGLVVEVDGGIHETQREADAERTVALCRRRLTVIRFPNSRIASDMAEVLAEIAAHCAALLPPPSPLWRGGRKNESIPMDWSFLAANRPLAVDTALGPGRLLLASLAGDEPANGLFALRLHLLAPKALPPVRLSDVVGRPMSATLRAPGGGSRQLHGVCARLTRRRDDLVFTHYEAELRPLWWAATFRLNTRAFQNLTAPDILRAVLSPLGPVESRLTTNYPTRVYTVQYEESDWDFAARLMEEEGIASFVRHDANGSALVLADRAAAFADEPYALPIPYEPTPNSVTLADRPAVFDWSLTQQMGPTELAVRGAHFALYRTPLDASSRVPNGVSAGDESLDLAPEGVAPVPSYDPRDDFSKRFDGAAPGGAPAPGGLTGLMPDADRVAGLRAEQAAAEQLFAEGRANTPALAPGRRFTLAGHPINSGDYVVTAITHDAAVPEAFWASEGEVDYRYEAAVRAVPASLCPRPALRTARPKVAGPLTAVVVGPAGSPVFVDQYGRVKVQFWWDRQGQFDANSSRWVRCSQLWAGKDWGAFFWPRPGMEVVVHFENGDPDRPVITGCVYNGENVPPGALPAEAGINGIKSCVLGGDPSTQYNALYIHDQPGVEYIQLHSERDDVQRTQANRFSYTPGLAFQVHGRL